MKSCLSGTILAIFLTVVFVAHSTFLIAPQKVHAQVTSFEVNPVVIKNTYESTISAIKNTLISVHSATSAVANVATKVNDYVLQPLAFALSGKLMKAITASTIKFVAGVSNGTGRSQFVTDLRTSMQSVGDSQALVFFAQFGKNSNSPFAYSISSSLRSNYYQQTSLNGFYVANQCTLNPSTRDAFLAGNWSKGGASAWFALTTQDNNNPYALYQNALIQSGSLVGNAVAARVTELNWGQGFMSWCGTGGTSTLGLAAPTSAAKEASDAEVAAGNAYMAAVRAASADPTNETLQAVSRVKEKELADAKVKANAAGSVGSNPGDPCTNKDGSPGTIRTPGSVIAASLNKALGGTQDKLAQMGQVGKEINGILKDVSTVANVANLAADILGGGASANSGGLLGSGQPSSVQSRTRLDEFSRSDYLGVSASDLSSSVATSLLTPEQMLSNIKIYQTAWGTIEKAANTASTNVTVLSDYCTAQATKAQGSAATSTPPIKLVVQTENAKDVLNNDISQALAQVAAANANVAAANALITKIKQEKKESERSESDVENDPPQPKAYADYTNPASYIADMSTRYNADLQTLQEMSPTAQDVADAQQDAKSSATATADPDGSLTVSGDSLIASMNLISANAKALKATCDARFAYATPSAIDDANGRIKQYELAWNAIEKVVSSTAEKLVAFKNTCNSGIEEAQAQAKSPEQSQLTPIYDSLGNLSYTAEQSVHTYNNLMIFIKYAAQAANDALTAYKDEVAPVLDQADTAQAVISKARLRVEEIGKELTTLTPADTARYNALMLELQRMSPTADDIVFAQKNSVKFNEVKADPPTSFNITTDLSKSSFVDRMALLSANTAVIKGHAVCNYASMTPSMSEWDGYRKLDI